MAEPSEKQSGNRPNYRARALELVPQREGLPIFSVKKELVDYIRDHQVTIIVGETGSGKTTQVPQYILEAGIGGPDLRIAVTQPRRVAATSVAQRVAEEVGTELGRRVGYSVRFDEKAGPATRLKYLTDGMLLREALLDPFLERYTTVIVDEAHERNVQTDICLGLLRQVASRRGLDTEHPLRIIVMSATMDTSEFAAFFAVRDVLFVQGRTYPVTRLYLAQAERDYVETAVETAVMLHFSRWEIEKSEWMQQQPDRDAEATELTPEERQQVPLGDILVFLTGQEEIDGARSEIQRRAARWQLARDLSAGVARPPTEEVPEENGEGELLRRLQAQAERAEAERVGSVPADLPDLEVLPLYAALPPEAQRVVFTPRPPHTRRIVLATNIAETSITLPTVRAVIDSGVVKQRSFTPETGVDQLCVVATSRAAVRQRAGRAGRTAPGVCYHLFTEDSFWNELPPQAPPEVLRTPLDGHVLTLAKLGFDRPQSFPWLTPPSRASLQHALRQLFHLKAVTGENGRIAITPRGEQLVQFPLPPADAAALLAGAERGVLPAILTIEAVLNAGQVFVQPARGTADAQQALAAHKALQVENSDHITLERIFSNWYQASRSKNAAAAESARRQWARTHWLNHRTLQHALSIREQLCDIAVAAGLGSARDLATSASLGASDNENVLRALCDAFFMHAAMRCGSERVGSARQGLGGAQFQCVGGITAALHPTSVVRSSRREVHFVLYHEVVETTQSYLRCVSVVEGDWLPRGLFGQRAF